VLANVFMPESPLRPTKLLRKALRVVGVLKGASVNLTEHQRELLKGNERLFSAQDLVRPRSLPKRFTHPVDLCGCSAASHAFTRWHRPPGARAMHAGAATDADGGGPGPRNSILGGGGEG
jgi:hypothetical protein